MPGICCELGISEGSFYNRRPKYAGMEANEAKRMKNMEAENAKLKKLLAEKLREVAAKKDVLSKKWSSQLNVSPSLVICSKRLG